MSVIINSIGLRGMNGYIVKVEVKLINGIGSFTIVGLPDLSVKEAKQRVMATILSLENANFDGEKGHYQPFTSTKSNLIDMVFLC